MYWYHVCRGGTASQLQLSQFPSMAGGQMTSNTDDGEKVIEDAGRNPQGAQVNTLTGIQMLPSTAVKTQNHEP